MPNKITLKQWSEHPTLRAEFEQLYNHPTMQLALGLARDYNEFPIPMPNVPGVNLIHVAALTGSRKEGGIEILLNLESLSKVTPVKPIKTPPFEREEPPAEPAK